MCIICQMNCYRSKGGRKSIITCLSTNFRPSNCRQLFDEILYKRIMLFDDLISGHRFVRLTIKNHAQLIGEMNYNSNLIESFVY